MGSSLHRFALIWPRLTSASSHLFGARVHKIISIIAFCFANTLICEKIFVIGDSHVREFQNIPQCHIYPLGPVTMHRIGKEGTAALNLANFYIGEGDVVVYVFGEIDVRCHVCKQRDLKNRETIEIINTLAENYIKTIVENKNKFQKITSIVYNIVPPVENTLNPLFPVWGTIQDRIAISKLLNTTLRSLCLQFEINFLDVYDYYADHNGTLLYELSDKNVHIDANHNEKIKEKLFEILKTRGA